MSRGPLVERRWRGAGEVLAEVPRRILRSGFRRGGCSLRLYETFRLCLFEPEEVSGAGAASMMNLSKACGREIVCKEGQYRAKTSRMCLRSQPIYADK